MAGPQFGTPDLSHIYTDRPAAFGIVVREGRVALVHIVHGRQDWHDLPGGGLEPGETPDEAVVRELGEEAGLVVVARHAFAHADQYFINTDGAPFNNRASFWAADLIREDASLKIEDDHALVWMEPHAALRALRHDAHAWALAAWLRRIAP